MSHIRYVPKINIPPLENPKNYIFNRVKKVHLLKHHTPKTSVTFQINFPLGKLDSKVKKKDIPL